MISVIIPTLNEAGNLPRPADTSAVLIVELHAETAVVVSLASVHEGWDVGVVKEPIIVLQRLTDQPGEEALDPTCHMRDEMLTELTAGIGDSRHQE